MDKKRIVALYLEARRMAGSEGMFHAANYIRKETRNEYMTLDALEKTPAVQEYLRQQRESEPQPRVEDVSELREDPALESEDAFSDSGTSPPEPPVADACDEFEAEVEVPTCPECGSATGGTRNCLNCYDVYVGQDVPPGGDDIFDSEDYERLVAFAPEWVEENPDWRSEEFPDAEPGTWFYNSERDLAIQNAFDAAQKAHREEEARELGSVDGLIAMLTAARDPETQAKLKAQREAFDREEERKRTVLESGTEEEQYRVLAEIGLLRRKYDALQEREAGPNPPSEEEIEDYLAQDRGDLPFTAEEQAEIEADVEERLAVAKEIEKLLAEVEAADDSKLSKKERKLRALNERFAVVTVGSDIVVLWERGDKQPVLLNVTNFRHLLANAGKVGKGGQLAANAWLAWPGRREYLGGVVFEPGEEAREDEYNLWRGWEVEPSKTGSCELFLQHIREVVCNGDDADAEWVLDWLAHVFQNPQEKPETVLALQGVPGAGKSIIGRVLKKLLGEALLATAEATQVTGRFNGHLANCLVLQAEEAFWAKDHHAERVLKHLATGEYLAIERKGVDVVNMRNFTRLLLTTNKDAVWPTSIDDRRLAIFRVASTHARDRKYFGAMLEQLEDGGYERLLDIFLSRKIDRDRLFIPPRTDALEEQAAYSLSPEEEWYLDLLTSGELPFSSKTELLEGGAARVPQAILYASYAWSVEAIRRRYAEPMNQKAFGYFLRKLPGKTSEERVRVYCPRHLCLVQSRWYELPALPYCREAYSSRGRGAVQSWGEPEQQWSIENEHVETEADEGGEAA